MGLLDQIFGAPGSDQGQAMSLLAAGLMRGDAGGGLLAANQVYSPEAKLKRSLLESQIAENQSQADARKLAVAKDARMQTLMTSIFGGGASPQPVMPGQFDGSQGAMPPTSGQPSAAPSQQGGAMNRMTPDQLAMLKLNGIDLTDVYKLANVPTSLAAGAYTQLPGQAPQYLPDPVKGIQYSGGRVSTMPGAANAQTELSLATALPQALLSAAGQVNLRENADGTKSPVSALNENPTLLNLVTRLGGGAGVASVAPAVQPQPRSLARPANPMAAQPGDSDQAMIFQQELASAQARLRAAKTPDEINRATQDMAGIKREMGRIGIAYGKTTDQEIAAKTQEARALALGKAQTERDVENTNKGNQFKDFRDQIGMAKTLLNAGPTASGIGSLTDSALNFAGVSTSSAEVARALDTTSKWLVQNIPKAPGAQSDAELRDYQGAAGLVGDRTVPVKQRLAALNTVDKLITTWEQRRAAAGQAGAAGGATGEFGQPASNPSTQTLMELPKSAPKGQRVRDTTTGKVLKFDGLSWKEEK